MNEQERIERLATEVMGWVYYDDAPDMIEWDTVTWERSYFGLIVMSGDGIVKGDWHPLHNTDAAMMVLNRMIDLGWLPDPTCLGRDDWALSLDNGSAIVCGYGTFCDAICAAAEKVIKYLEVA